MATWLRPTGRPQPWSGSFPGRRPWLHHRVPIRYLFDAAGHPASIGRATDLAQYLALVHTGLEAGSLRPYASRRRLSDAAGLCEDTVSASLKPLEAAGLIRHLGQANDYGTHRYEILSTDGAGHPPCSRHHTVDRGM